MKQLFGKAILDFQTKNDPQPLITETSVSEPEELDVSYLFRSYDAMPDLERKAIDLSRGSVLDVGCGAGSHALYLQEKGIKITAIDISADAIKTCKLRGVENAIKADIMTFAGKFDTVLVLMNGTGLSGTLDNLPNFLGHLKSLLTDGGQVLIDSSDLIYLFEEDEDGGLWVPGDRYYGEVDYMLAYKGETETLPWLYVDFDTLSGYAEGVGLKTEKILDGPNYDYLARLKNA